ncbi:MAG: tetratricopeptide repeat protein, partial [Burkholderiaceae bacterium]|nr:tetratricopeptide repeat protein [Burkholderiaceae bacterium]
RVPAQDLRARLLATIELHQRGHLAQAIEGYRQVLQSSPLQFDALRLLGAALYQSRELKGAVDALRQAVAIEPGSAEAWGNLATALAELKQHEQAERAFARLLELRPDQADAHSWRAIELAELGRSHEAALQFQRAVATDPGQMQVWLRQANALTQRGKPREALRCLEGAARLAPQSIPLQLGIARALLADRRIKDAEFVCDAMLPRAPDDVEVLRLHAKVLFYKGWAGEALAVLDRLRALGDPSADVFLFRGSALRDLRRYDEALGEFDAFLQRSSTNWAGWLQKASSLQQLGRAAEAQQCLDSAAVMGAEEVEYWRALALDRAEAGEHRAALAGLERALVLAPDDAGVRLERALLLLKLGDFSTGWAEYAARFEAPYTGQRRPQHARDWIGSEPLAKKSVLVYSEQGMGDTIQFCRYAPQLAQMGADVLLSVQPPLVDLLWALPGVHVLSGDEPAPPVEYQCALLDLPHALGIRLDTIADAGPYLQAEPTRVADWSKRLGSARGVVRVGLACSGSASHPMDRARSIALSKFARLVAPRIELHLVQNDLRGEDEESLQTLPIADHRSRLNDFAETAALLSCLDLAITVDTSVAHLAGALGIPVWVLLPVNADWRWLLDRDDSPWYSSVRLFRQSAAGDWDTVMSRVSQALSQLDTRLQGDGSLPNYAQTAGQAR